MYKCLQQSQYSSGPFLFECLRDGDEEPIRVWRNEQIDILRQAAPITKEEQQRYFQTEISRSYQEVHPKQILFRIAEDSDLLGYGGLTHIDWERKTGEVSFLLDTTIKETSSSFHKVYHAFIEMLAAVAFQELHFKKLTAEVYIFRKGMIQLLEEAGFHKTGCLKDHVCKRGQKWDALQYERHSNHRKT